MVESSSEKLTQTEVPRARREGASTRLEILQLATALFAESSYHAASLRELASRAQMKAGSIYYHFSSKEELLASIVTNAIDSLLVNLSSISSDGVDPRQYLQQIVARHLLHCFERPDETRIILEQSQFLNPENQDRTRVKQRVVLDFYRDHIEACFVPPEKLPAPSAILALTALASINAFSQWANPDRGLGGEELIKKTSAFVVAGIFKMSDYETS